MDLEQRPGWSKGDLRRLGEALVIDKAATPDGCPQYGDVMRWHNELAAEVAIRIATELWVTTPPDRLSITARAKTVDTIVQKLQRETTLKLGQVVDLAGVRVDADIVLDQQTELAEDIAEYFGAARAKIKDMRETPHSGYRGVHVWLALPAGRVEVQIRTHSQSEWANAYEALGEIHGRGIRYGEEHENAEVRDDVDKMHLISAGIARIEEYIDLTWRLERAIESLIPQTPYQVELLAQAREAFEQRSEHYKRFTMGLKMVQTSLRWSSRTKEELQELDDLLESVSGSAPRDSRAKNYRTNLAVGLSIVKGLLPSLRRTKEELQQENEELRQEVDDAIARLLN